MTPQRWFVVLAPDLTSYDPDERYDTLEEAQVVAGRENLLRGRRVQIAVVTVLVELAGDRSEDKVTR